MPMSKKKTVGHNVFEFLKKRKKEREKETDTHREQKMERVKKLQAYKKSFVVAKLTKPKNVNQEILQCKLCTPKL